MFEPSIWFAACSFEAQLPVCVPIDVSDDVPSSTAIDMDSLDHTQARSSMLQNDSIKDSDEVGLYTSFKQTTYFVIHVTK